MKTKNIVLALALLALPAVVQAQFTYTTNNGAITITGYTGPGGDVTIPATINGLPVTSIGDSAFYNKSAVTSVTIGNGVTSIGFFAFGRCTSLAAIAVDTNNPAYSSVAGVLFDKSQTTLIQYPGAKPEATRFPTASPASGTMRSITAPAWPASRFQTASPASETKRSNSAKA